MDDRDLTLEDLKAQFPDAWDAYYTADQEAGTVDAVDDDEPYEDFVRRHMRFYVRDGKLRVNDIYHPCEFTWVPETLEWEDLYEAVVE